MKGLWLLSLRHVAHNRTQTAVLVCCLAVPMYLPLASGFLVQRYRAELEARADATPLLAGAKGNRFDLTLAVLYFRRGDLEPLPLGELGGLVGPAEGLAIPMHVRFTARGHPVVGTSPEYFELRGLAPAEGGLPLLIGECVLGAAVARELGLGPGDVIFSDQREVYDISVPPALKMAVVGVLAPTGGPDDRAVFTDAKTAWVLEGLSHGHGDVTEGLDEALVLGRAEGHVAVSQALIEYNEVTAQNLATFHVHGAPGALPLTGAIVVPRDAKARTLVKARVNASERWQMVAPSAVVADLLAYVFRVKALFDTFSAVLGAAMVAMTVLVLLLSTRLRRAEIDTLHRIGCSRTAVLRLLLIEVLAVLGLAAAVAGAGFGATVLALPRIAELLS